MSHCGICSDMFDGVERIGATPCGHVYHTQCLFKWFDRAKTCPQCREKVQRQNVLELYLNINKSEHMNPPSLCNEVENLKSLLQERRTEASDLFNKNTELREMVVKHETTIRSLQQRNFDLEHRTKTLSELPILRVSLENTKRKLAELRNEMQSYEDIKTVIAGAQEDAEEVLRQSTDEAISGFDYTVSRKLATCCSLIKRELRRAVDEKNNLRKEVTELNKNLGLTSSKLRHSKATEKDLKKRIEQLEKAARIKVSCSSPDSDSSFPSELVTSCDGPENCISPKEYFKMTPISIGSERKDKQKMNIVVLDKEKKKVSEKSERSLSPVLFSPLPKRLKETDSVSSTGYNGLGGHHSIIIRAEDVPRAGTSKKFALVPTKKKFRKL